MGKGNNGLLGKKRGPYKKHIPLTLRQLAKEAGDLYYIPTKPCKNGHFSKRLTSDGSCYACQPLKRKRLRSKPGAKERHNAKTRAWKQKNKAYVKAYRQEYFKKNPDVKRASQSRRRAKTKKADGFFTKQDIQDLKVLQNYLCLFCSVDLNQTGYHIDHKLPLSRGGSNWPSNLQLLCPGCNIRKHNKTDEEFLSLGRI